MLGGGRLIQEGCDVTEASSMLQQHQPGKLKGGKSGMEC